MWRAVRLDRSWKGRRTGRTEQLDRSYAGADSVAGPVGEGRRMGRTVQLDRSWKGRKMGRTELEWAAMVRTAMTNTESKQSEGQWCVNLFAHGHQHRELRRRRISQK